MLAYKTGEKDVMRMWRSGKTIYLAVGLTNRKIQITNRNLFFCGLEKFFQFFRAHAFLRISAPLDAGRSDRTGVQMAALLAGRLGLIGPDLDLLAALLAPDVLGLGLANLYASRATFLKHGSILLLSKQGGYDIGHMRSEVLIPGWSPSRSR